MNEAHSTENFEKKFETNVIFVKNISFKATEEELVKYFKEQGVRVKRARLVRDKVTHKFRGFAYLELEDYQDVTNAIHLGPSKDS